MKIYEGQIQNICNMFTKKTEKITQGCIFNKKKKKKNEKKKLNKQKYELMCSHFFNYVVFLKYLPMFPGTIVPR